MNNHFTKDATTLYNKYYKMLWWFSHKYKVDIGDCEIAFINCVKNYDGQKSSFSNYLWLGLKHEVWKNWRNSQAIKRKTEHLTVDYDPELVGVKPQQSLWQVAKDILTQQEYNLIYNIFACGYSQQEMAIKYNLSQAHISRKVNSIISKLREVVGGKNG